MASGIRQEFPWLNPLEIKNNGTTRIVEQIVKSFLFWGWFTMILSHVLFLRDGSLGRISIRVRISELLTIGIWDLSFILHCCWWWGGRPQEQQILWWSFEEPIDKSAPQFLAYPASFWGYVFFCWWINILRSKKGVQIMCQFSTKFSQYIKVTNKLNYQGRLPPPKIITYTFRFPRCNTIQFVSTINQNGVLQNPPLFKKLWSQSTSALSPPATHGFSRNIFRW